MGVARRFGNSRRRTEPSTHRRIPHFRFSFTLPQVGPDDPYWLYQEVLRLRELLALVAAELERLAAEETDPRRRAVLLKRAMRIRARLHEAWPRG